MENPRICLLGSCAFDEGKTIRGAALVTDLKSEPIEFRCTSAVRPTQLQRIVWGDRLAGYVTAKLIGKPLLDALNTPVALVIVREADFVEVREFIETPLVQLVRNEDLDKASSHALGETDDDVIGGAGGRFESVVVKVHQKYPDDKTFFRELLAETLRSRSILEPFDRLIAAVEMVHRQEAP